MVKRAAMVHYSLFKCQDYSKVLLLLDLNGLDNAQTTLAAYLEPRSLYFLLLSPTPTSLYRTIPTKSNLLVQHE